MAILLCLSLLSVPAFADSADSSVHPENPQEKQPLLSLFYGLSDDYTEKEFLTCLDSMDSIEISFRGVVQTHGGHFYFVTTAEDSSAEIDLIFSPDGKIISACFYDKPEELADKENLSACFNSSDVKEYYSATETTGFFITGIDSAAFPIVFESAAETVSGMYELYSSMTA
ncbi:MAG: hypothetical protein K6C08_07590 [Oscillospiraceae bacterium]|nr:hypothetical protein [Oscillospiraceae bacterium]